MHSYCFCHQFKNLTVQKCLATYLFTAGIYLIIELYNFSGSKKICDHNSIVQLHNCKIFRYKNRIYGSATISNSNKGSFSLFQKKVNQYFDKFFNLLVNLVGKLHVLFLKNKSIFSPLSVIFASSFI